MIDDILGFLIPFFAASTILFGAWIASGWLWSMLPLFISIAASNVVLAVFWFSAIGFMLSFAVGIFRR